jgi:hypothetical protein
MKQVMMKELNILEIGDLGVKPYEILFQKMVEDTLEANGFSECWWQALNHEPIFMTIWDIYALGSSEDHSVIFSLQEYYDKIRKMTDEWIGAKLCK